MGGDDGQRIELGELAELALDAATGDGDWGSVCEQVVHQLALDGFTIDVRCISAGLAPVEMLGSVGLAADVHRAYREHFHSVDPVAHRAVTAGPGVAVQAHSLVQRSALQRTEYWNDFAHPFGLTETLGAWAPLSDDLLLILGGNRTRGPAFSRAEERWFEQTFRLLSRCARLATWLRANTRGEKTR